MFLAKLKESEKIKKLIESIKDIVSEINLECSPTGINLQAMDGSHVALVTVNLNCDGFEEYRCDKIVNLGINVGNLWKLMKCASNDDSFLIKADVNPNQIQITFENSSAKKCCVFNLSLIQIDSEHLGIPETNHGSVVMMNSNEFNKITKELYHLSETVNIETNQSYVSFSIQGDQVNGCIKIENNDTSNSKTMIKGDEAVNLAFALRYLNMFTKATSLSEFVYLYLSNDYPLKVEYVLDGLGSLKYYLAPRIAEDGK